MTLKLSDFDFDLPQDFIAQRPAQNREDSRLMVVERKNESIRHDVFSNLPTYLIGRPLITFNNTRVVPAKLIGHKKDSGRQVEALLIREEKPGIWEAFVKGLARLKPGAELVFGNGQLTAVLRGRRGDRGILQLNSSGDLRSVLEEVAHMPLPHYIRRGLNADSALKELDRERYQTVYAANEGWRASVGILRSPARN